MKTLCDIEGEISNWISAIYKDKKKTFSVKMITNTDLLPQRYHFLLGMVKDLNVFPFDNDMK